LINCDFDQIGQNFDQKGQNFDQKCQNFDQKQKPQNGREQMRTKSKKTDLLARRSKTYQNQNLADLILNCEARIRPIF